jgi:hypothetical protein
VALTLRIALAELLPAAAATAPAGAAPDGGAAPVGSAVIALGWPATPAWFAAAGGRCAPAPRWFETLAEARAAGGELPAAALVRSHHELMQVQQEAAAAGRPAPRLVAVVRSAGTGGGAK